MDRVDNNEVWKQIPPEEKIELLSSAHSTGLLISVITVIISGTLAIGFHASWILWFSLLISPLVFQYGAGTAWRSIRPRVMLEYLAARSAARRYAFNAKSQNLHLELMFRGTMERQFDEEQVHESLEAAVSNNLEAEVWVALFHDAVVMMSEQPGGARVEFVHVLDQTFKHWGESEDGGGEYSKDRKVFLAYETKQKGSKIVKLWSRYPAALIVFEKKLRQLHETALEEAKKKAEAAVQIEDLAEVPAAETKSSDDLQFFGEMTEE